MSSPMVHTVLEESGLSKEDPVTTENTPDTAATDAELRQDGEAAPIVQTHSMKALI